MLLLFNVVFSLRLMVLPRFALAFTVTVAPSPAAATVTSILSASPTNLMFCLSVPPRVIAGLTLPSALLTVKPPFNALTVLLFVIAVLMVVLPLRSSLLASIPYFTVLPSRATVRPLSASATSNVMLGVSVPFSAMVSPVLSAPALSSKPRLRLLVMFVTVLLLLRSS